MEKQKIDRINELAKKSREIGLTPEEKEEQTLLRNEYRAGFVRNFNDTLEHTYIIDEKGKAHRALRKEEKE